MNPTIIDQGTTLAEVAMDLDQTSRPQGIAHDLGAHEFAYRTSLKNYANEKSSYSIYPNPAKNVISIESNTVLMSKIRIMDLLGQSIALYDNLNELNFKVELENLKPRIYICQITDERDKIERFKILVE